MKFFFPAFVFLVCLCVVGCHKDADTDIALDITGKWELRYVFDGMAVPDPSAIVPGNGTIYTFRNHSFTYYQSHVAVDSGTYTTVLNDQPGDDIPLSLIAFNTTDTLIYSFTMDTLNLYPIFPTTDGYYRRFVKIGK